MSIGRALRRAFALAGREIAGEPWIGQPHEVLLHVTEVRHGWVSGPAVVQYGGEMVAVERYEVRALTRMREGTDVQIRA